MPVFKAPWICLALLFCCLILPAHANKAEASKNRAEADALFTNAVVLVVKIDMPQRSVNALRQSPRRDVAAMVREYLPSNTREPVRTYNNVKVHLKGHWGSFRPLDDKPGFTLKLDETNGVFHGLKKLHLNNSVQDGTYLSEWLCGELFRAAGVPMPRAAHALVELNGRRLGLYVIKEGINRDFLAQYFQNTRGNVYGQSTFIDVNGPIERMGGHEDDTNRADLRRLASAAMERDPARLRERLPQVLDLDRFLSFMAMEIMLCDWDGYVMKSHNYRVYHNLDEDKMVFIPHDKDQMIGNPKLNIMPVRPQGLVAQAIMRLPETRERYRARFGELFTNVFVAPVLIERINSMVARLGPAIQSYDPQIAQELRSRAASLKNRVHRRALALQNMQNKSEDGPLNFVNGSAPLKGWYPMNDLEGVKVERVQDNSGKTCLWIQAEAKCGASWRLAVSLPPGSYVFEGMARCANIEPISDAKRGQGAGLRISGTSQGRANNLVGDSSWKRLAYQFRVTDSAADVTLVCEMLANQGEVWFDESSLRLRLVQ